MIMMKFLVAAEFVDDGDAMLDPDLGEAELGQRAGRALRPSPATASCHQEAGRDVPVAAEANRMVLVADDGLVHGELALDGDPQAHPAFSPVAAPNDVLAPVRDD